MNGWKRLPNMCLHALFDSILVWGIPRNENANPFALLCIKFFVCNSAESSLLILRLIVLYREKICHEDQARPLLTQIKLESREYKIFLGFEIVKHFSTSEIFSVKLRIFHGNLNNCVVLAATIIIL